MAKKMTAAEIQQELLQHEAICAERYNMIIFINMFFHCLSTLTFQNCKVTFFLQLAIGIKLRYPSKEISSVYPV